MKFFFKAKTELGEVREGFVDAISSDFATEILQKNGLIVLSVRAEEQETPFFRQLQKLWEGVKPQELALFFRQLSTLIEAKVPVTSSLGAIAEQINNEYLRVVILEMKNDIDDGMPFSEALERHTDVFSPLVINMVKAGEMSGGLQRSIKFVADNIEKNYHLTSKIKGAFFYPGFVIVVASIIGFLVITFILPKITQIIKDMNIDVPWYTKVLMWLGDFMSNYWGFVFLGICGIVVGLVYYFQSEAGKYDMEEIVLKIPILGEISSRMYLIRFAENLAALLQAGIPITRALDVVGNVVGNHVYRNVIEKALSSVRTGGTMSQVFASSSVMPPMVTPMVRIGEETGSTVNVLTSVSEFYEQEIEVMTRNMTALIEPVLIVVLGIGVAILVVGVLMPIYNISGQF